MDSLETCSRMLCSEGDWGAENRKVDRYLQNGASLVRDGERMAFSRISSVLPYSVILEQALPFVITLFILFRIDSRGPFAGILQEVLGEAGFHWEDTGVKMTFARSGSYWECLFPS